jgi:3-(3-hydroxy-phenyl)propionate hydroxylase
MDVIPTTGSPVLICGAGPVGLTLTLALARLGVPVTVFEAGPGLNPSSQASTFHASTLELLDEIGVAWSLVGMGRVVERLQYRDRREGLVAEFHFSLLRDLTRFPIRLQVEQTQLTSIILDQLLKQHPHAQVRFRSKVIAAANTARGGLVTVECPAGVEHHVGSFVIGADGAHSTVRRSLGIAFEGSTYPTRHLMISTTYDVLAHMPELAPVTYVFDDREVVGVLSLRNICRVVFMVPAEEPAELVLAPHRIQERLAGFLPRSYEPYPVLDARLATVHARVAQSYWRGHVLLAGDAAHLNHPMGGMGLNSGIHDAFALADAVARVWHGKAGMEALADYAETRRRVAVGQVMPRADRYHDESVERGDEARRHRNARLRQIAADRDAARRWLIEASLLDSMPLVAGWDRTRLAAARTRRRRPWSLRFCTWGRRRSS